MTVNQIMTAVNTSENPSLVSKSFTIAVASGKGGTGKTFVATNLFAQTQVNQKSVLVDCDAEVPDANLFFRLMASETIDVVRQVNEVDLDLCLHCGNCSASCQFHALFCIPEMRIIKIDKDLCRGCGVCEDKCSIGAIRSEQLVSGTVSRFLLPSGNSIVEARTNVETYSPVDTILKAIQMAGKDGLIILDAPPGISCPFIRSVVLADFIVLVAEPTPFGLHDLKLAVETLRLIKKPFGVVVNKLQSDSLDIEPYLKSESIPLLSSIAYSRDLADQYARGRLPVLNSESCKKTFLSLYDSIMKYYADSICER